MAAASSFNSPRPADWRDSIRVRRLSAIANEPRFFARQMLLSLARIRCGLQSAIRTRRTAKRAVNRPLVPRRQLTVFQVVPASIVSATAESVSGMECLRGRPWPGIPAHGGNKPIWVAGVGTQTDFAPSCESML